LVGDLKEIVKLQMEARSKPMNLSHDIVPRVFAHLHQSVLKHGMLLFLRASPTGGALFATIIYCLPL